MVTTPYKVRWFSPKGGVLQLADATSKDGALANRNQHVARYRGRFIVLQKMRGGWHVIYDSDLGY